MAGNYGWVFGIGGYNLEDEIVNSFYRVYLLFLVYIDNILHFIKLQLLF